MQRLIENERNAELDCVSRFIPFEKGVDGLCYDARHGLVMLQQEEWHLDFSVVALRDHVVWGTFFPYCRAETLARLSRGNPGVFVRLLLFGFGRKTLANGEKPSDKSTLRLNVKQINFTWEAHMVQIPCANILPELLLLSGCLNTVRKSPF